LQIAAKNGVLPDAINGLQPDEKAILIKHLLENKGENNLAIAREILNTSVDKAGKPEKDKILDSKHIEKNDVKLLLQEGGKALKDLDKEKLVDNKNLKDALLHSVNGSNNNESALTMVRALNNGNYDEVLKDIPAGDISDLMDVVRSHGNKDDLQAFQKKLADVSGAKIDKLSDKDKAAIFNFKIEKDPDKAIVGLAKQSDSIIREIINSDKLKQDQLAKLGKALSANSGKIDDLTDGAADQGSKNAAVKILDAMLRQYAADGGATVSRDEIQNFIKGIDEDATEDDNAMDALLKMLKENKLEPKDAATKENLQWLITNPDNSNRINSIADEPVPNTDIFK
jgi:uncharacterized protein (DUF302 family)